VLRFWETEFKTMIPPKSRSKQRMYRRKDIETILTIKHLLYKERYTIEGARKRLLELQRGITEPEPSATAVASETLAELKQDLLSLRELLESAPSDSHGHA